MTTAKLVNDFMQQAEKFGVQISWDDTPADGNMAAVTEIMRRVVEIEYLIKQYTSIIID